MNKSKRKTKLKDKSGNALGEKLNHFAVENIETKTVKTKKTVSKTEVIAKAQSPSVEDAGAESEVEKRYKVEIKDLYIQLFGSWEEEDFIPQDFKPINEIDVSVNSLESKVGYSSLIRQLHDSYLKTIAYYTSKEGGLLTVEEARKKVFHACTNEEEALKELRSLMRLPLDQINFIDLLQLQSYSPRAAERFWERAKKEGQAEFESGHLGANVMFPAHYKKALWNIARYLGVRESFIIEWKPRGGIEISLIDMLTQSYFQWQYWIEQTILRSQMPAREEHSSYKAWKESIQAKDEDKSWLHGYWFPPYVSEQQAIEHAVQMTDRWNRIYMRTLRQLRDLRRYSPVTINNPSQVNIAAGGGQQVNVTNPDEQKIKTITS
jgi:hypothetical protein